MEKITIDQLNFLKLIYELSQRNEFKLATTQEIIREITKQKNVTDIAVRKMLHVIYKKGYIENPIRGGWRLTSKGLQIINEVKK